MNKFILKKSIQAITFKDLVEYSELNSPAPHFSFKYNKLSIIKDSNSCFLIYTQNGTFKFTSEDILATDEFGEFKIYKESIFNKKYTSDWIDAREKLPECTQQHNKIFTSGKLLVWTDDGIEVDEYLKHYESTNEGYKLIKENWMNHENITHWMKSPFGPKND